MLNEALSKMPDVFDPKILLQGLEYFQKDQVLSIRLSDGLFKGRVKGSSGQIYDIHMDLKLWPGKPAQCSCAYRANCKHAVACFFALRDREKANLPAYKLDRKLDAWLKNLQVQTQAILKPKEVSHHLLYLITLKRSGHEHKVVIQLALAKLLKKGGYGKKTIFYGVSESKKQYFIEDDNEIVAQLLFKQGTFNWFNQFTIRNSELLEKIIATGRAFLTDDEEYPLRLSEPLIGSCEWHLQVNGEQSLKLMHQDQVLEPLLIDDSWYFDSFELILGRLSTPYTVKQLHYLLEAPPIPLDQVELFTAKMLKICPEFPKPSVFKQKEVRTIQAIPVFILDVLHPSDLDVIYIGKVAFNYSGLIIAYNESTAELITQQDGVLIEFQRDKVYEQQKVDELHSTLELRALTPEECEQLGVATQSIFLLEGINKLEDMSILYSKVLPLLKNKGWLIEFASSLYQEVILEKDIEWFSEVEEQKTDFFSYQLGILIEGQPVSIVPLVAELIRKYTSEDLDCISDEQTMILPLHDGRALQLPMGRIKPLIRLLLQLGLKSVDADQLLHMNKFQLILMQETELALKATQARWQGAETIRTQLQHLVNLEQLPQVRIPAGLKTQLREYQHQGLNWLQYLRNTRFSGVLADDMGLGKTVQTLAHLQYEKEQGLLTQATLIIAPTSLVGNWLAEAKRFTPELSVLVYHGSERHQDDFDGYDVVISTYGLIHRDKEKFIHYQFYYLILDEAQFIKNARTKTTQIIQQLKATHRLCLTGTPLENHLGELWSLFHFLMPGLLGDHKQFKRWFRTPIEKYADLERRELLAKRVKPFMLRRTKNQVERELPPKTEMTRTIELTGTQRDLYEAIRMSMEKKVRDAIAKQGLGKSHILLLDALLKLRQVCCDPRLLSLPEAAIAHGNSAKLEALMELLDNLVEEGRRVLVFSQFTSMLKLIEEQLDLKHYPYLKLTGQSQNRQHLVEQFQQGETPIFLISLKAGGTGLNLTRADTVIHYDPWWNPAVEDQATDRTHRIGQEHPVFVYKLITTGTVEEAIMEMQARKRHLAEGILSADLGASVSLKEEDLEKFFVPLN